MLQSPIGRVVSQPMRNIETYVSLSLSLVERKVAEFYHKMVRMTYFHRFLQTIDGVLIKLIIKKCNLYNVDLSNEKNAEPLVTIE